MNKIGLIQGRLSPRPYPKLQEFPRTTWEKEFNYAKETGYDYIEWIFELDEYDQNPLWTEQGRKRIRHVAQMADLPVLSICADYFLERPFFRTEGCLAENRFQILEELIKKASEIEAKIILLPVLEKAEIRNEEEGKKLMEILQKSIPLLEEFDVSLGLETELKADDYRKLCQSCRSPKIGAYYDTGNCTFRGYDMAEDMEILSDQILSVHVKDRKIGGRSVFLGQGDVNFSEGIAKLLDQGYRGNFTLQTYFEDSYLETAKVNLAYMKELLKGDQI